MIGFYASSIVHVTSRGKKKEINQIFQALCRSMTNTQIQFTHSMWGTSTSPNIYSLGVAIILGELAKHKTVRKKYYAYLPTSLR